MKKTAILNLNDFHENTSPDSFYANTLEKHLLSGHKDISVPHKHNFYLSVIFLTGQGKHEVDFESYDVKPGAVFFLNPGQTHHWELSANTTGYIFFHSQEFYELHYTHNRLNQLPFFYSVHNSPCIYLDRVNINGIKELFQAILAETESVEPFQKQVIISLIDLIYAKCSRIYPQIALPSGEHNNYFDKYRRFEDLITRHYPVEKSPSAYADMLNVSPKHLNRITQAVIGKTASDVILERVLLEAKRELVLHKKSFSEIAQKLGYDDYAYFSRIFKKKTGETPRSFLARYIS